MLMSRYYYKGNNVLQDANGKKPIDFLDEFRL